jgi:ribosomal protein L4
VVAPGQADPLSLVRYQNVVITKAAIDKIQEILA